MHFMINIFHVTSFIKHILERRPWDDRPALICLTLTKVRPVLPMVGSMYFTDPSRRLMVIDL